MRRVTLLDRAEAPHDLADAEAGGVLEVAGDGQGGEDDGQVGLDGLAGVVEHEPGAEVGLAHPERRLDVT